MILSSNRLVLRTVEIKDAVALFEYKKLKEITELQGRDYHSLQEVIELISENPAEFNIENSWYQLVIIDRELESIVGDLGLHFIGPENMQMELGITISPQFQRKGYAKEVITMILDYAFRKLKKHRIYASIDPHNIASVQLFESLNFRKEAHFKQSYYQNGIWKDDLIYAMLNKEYNRLLK